jgi:hypothetical protein
MFVYFGMLLMPAFLALVSMRRRVALQLLFPFFVLFVILIGLRDKVGMDWNNYLAIFRRISNYTLTEALSTSEPGFTFLIWLSSWAGFDVYGTNCFAALIFSLGLFSVCRVAREPWLALVAAVPYLVVAVAMSGVRQSIAIGIVFMLIANWRNFSFILRVSFILAASLFHLSAIFLLILVALELKVSLIYKFGLVALISGLSAYVLSTMEQYVEHIGFYSDAYLSEESIYSPGALQHVLQIAVPASLYLLNRRAWTKLYGENYLLFMMSILSLAAVPGVLVWSTAVDRMSLYLFSVPMLVYAGLPYLLRSSISSVATRLLIISLNFLVMAVWLNYANNAYSYLPYGNILF